MLRGGGCHFKYYYFSFSINLVLKISTRSFSCQCPEISLREASTQVNERMIDNSGSCSVSRVTVCNESYVRIIKSNIRPKIKTITTKSYQVNNKLTLAKSKTRSISTSKPNFSAV